MSCHDGWRACKEGEPGRICQDCGEWVTDQE